MIVSTQRKEQAEDVVDRWYSRWLGMRLLASFSLLVCACSPDARVGSAREGVRTTDIAVYQAVVASRTLGDRKASFPLVAVFDRSGRSVGHTSSWSPAIRQELAGMLGAEGARVGLQELLALLGLPGQTVEQRVVIAVSLGEACEPCVQMEGDLNRIAQLHPDIRFELLRASPRAGSEPDQ